MVDSFNDDGRLVRDGFVGSEHGTAGLGPEQRASNGHQHGGGNTLAADVADAETDVVVEHEEVIEIAAHLACRRQRSEQFQVVAVGCSGECLRNH